MNEKNKISVVINTYNAEQHLDRVLKAVKDFDEILVCDMESTDRTLAIAQEHGCRIVTFERKQYNIVEPAREFAIQSATNKWVLVVDADEVVTPELRSELYKIIELPDSANGYYIPRQNIFMGMFVRDFHYDYQLRFFIREGTYWPPLIHALPKVQGRVDKLKGNKQACLLHLMDETIHEYITKMNEYTDNEVEKKADKGYGIGALIWRPIWRFFKSYFLSGGYRMGSRGLIRSMLAAQYQFVLVVKIIEKRLREKC